MDFIQAVFMGIGFAIGTKIVQGIADFLRYLKKSFFGDRPFLC